jgi:hypothetical protein
MCISLFASSRSDDDGAAPARLGASKGTSSVFLRMRMKSRSASLDLLATKVELLLRAMLRPCLVEPMDGILRLDPESLKAGITARTEMTGGAYPSPRPLRLFLRALRV